MRGSVAVASLKQVLFVVMQAMLLIGTAPVLADARVESGSATALSQEQGDAILQELKAIRQLLEKMGERAGAQPVAGRPAAPRTATVKIESDRYRLGADTAAVTVIEYTDYQCPYCRRFVQSTFPLLKRDYIDTGKVSWQVRDLPLGFHKEARKAAQAALCAGDQEHFWPMRDSLFRNSASLDIEQLKAYAAELGLDQDIFAQCLDGERHLARIDADAAAANQLRITGTPTFVIGKQVRGELHGNLIIGAQAPAVFAAEIQRVLEQQ